MSRIETLTANAEQVVGEDELLQRIRSGKKLRVKLGVDPTRPDLTFGHMVVFNKMKQFQDMGHDCILLIGDFTATIGDPSGRNDTRPVLTEQEVRHNAETYLEQAFRILDEERTLVRFNSEWFNKLGFADCLGLARQMTVARMLERDDFAKRHASQTPISIIEFLYPLVQGFDSVQLRADVELGGTDQLFNMLVGRQLQKEAGQPEQAVITLPLLLGLDGVKKMSKSLDNYIAFNDSATDMFQKVMSINDETMWDYYRLLLLMDEPGIQRHQKDHPREAKLHLASSLVAQFHSLECARNAMADYEAIASSSVPANAQAFKWPELAGTMEAVLLADVMAATGLFASKKEIKRIIEQGGVKVDNTTVTDAKHACSHSQCPFTVQAGKKKFFQVIAH
jgi:tyrosyl-tRNA synthetase